MPARRNRTIVRSLRCVTRTTRSRNAFTPRRSICTRSTRNSSARMRKLAALRAQRERIARERASLRLRLDVTRKNARVADRRLAVLVRNLYEQQASDPLAIVLGAESLEDAITTLDDLSRSAQTHHQIAQTSLHAKSSLITLRHTLDRRMRTYVRTKKRLRAPRPHSFRRVGAKRPHLGAQCSRATSRKNRSRRIDALAQASAAASTPAAAPAPGRARCPPARGR